MLQRFLRHEALSKSTQAVLTLPSNLPSFVNVKDIQLILGARKTAYVNWISTDRDLLDVTLESDWQRLLAGRKASRLLAEHVWEHLSPDQMNEANRLAFSHLAEGGSLRIAVPDGFNPDRKYIASVRPGGDGRSADEHLQLLNYKSLSQALLLAGFEVELLEYWDEYGNFHYRPWQSKDGYIKRSLLHDRRNRAGVIGYTSLIVDARKPLWRSNG